MTTNRRLKAQEVVIVSPLEQPDPELALAAARAGAAPMLALGRDLTAARTALERLSDSTAERFGVSFVVPLPGLRLPAQVSRALLPWGMEVDLPDWVEPCWQVHDVEEAAQALAAGASSIVLKGNEGAGLVGSESTFVLFQRIVEAAGQAGARLFVQGGVGVHSGAAYLNLGAHGLVLDSQIVLLPECRVPKELQDRLARLDANSTMLVGGRRVLKWPAGPKLGSEATPQAVAARLGGLDLEHDLIPLGQDFALAGDWRRRYGRLDALVRAIQEAAWGHARQAQRRPALRRDSELARAHGTALPIAQGPMARVSDEPEFIAAVSQAGALPFLAIGLADPEATTALVERTAARLAGQPWGAGLLGFIPPALFDEQARRVVQAAPTAVVIAGGRPAQGKLFERAGIAAFLHVPSATLLSQYLNEGARRFIFEGRESGGHVGPLHSTVLWERQLLTLLDFQKPDDLEAYFAGGVNDALSSAFVSLMAAPLAARGAKVGALMGTAYLATVEAVASGAITQDFQDQVLSAQSTVLLESVPGQETRALPTPFTEFFEAEKRRISATAVEPLDKRRALEELNLGRARIASKGTDRSGPLPLARRRTEGLYMSGAITPLITRATDLERLHRAVTDDAAQLLAELDVPPTPPKTAAGVEPIAIIGLAGVFPDAADVHEFWRNCLIGHDAISEVPVARWDPEQFFDPDSDDTDKVVSKWGGFIGPTEFDPLEFGIAPGSMRSIETAQLISLMVAKRALQDAGYADPALPILEDTSVIFGAVAQGELANSYGSRSGVRSLFGSLPQRVDQQLPKVDEDSFAGILSNVISGRIANRLNCRGRNFTVDAACASSLAALDVACNELWAGRARMVLCGGADLHNGIVDYVMFNATRALSRQGRSAAFDESGDGLALGEGVGVVVLKRLSDAERDQDRIYAVVRGIDGSSDGRSLGLTAPNMSGQSQALRRAYRTAGVSPAQLGLLEAHGTGTAVGDRTELAALQQVLLDAGALPGQTWIGSVKTQIGHTKSAAGLAGTIRAALSLYHGVIPPTLHLKRPVAVHTPDLSPFRFNAGGHATVWPADRRVAGVSGFGFGGTNFHAVLENYAEVPDQPIMAAWPRELFVFRGQTREAAQARLSQVLEAHRANPRLVLRDVSYSLFRQSAEPVQIAIVSGSWNKLVAKIGLALEGKPGPGLFYRDPCPGKVVFLFSGQGSQRVNMARELFVMFPRLRHALARHPEYQSVVFPDSRFDGPGRQAQRQAVTDTRNAQPLLGFVDLAIAELLTSLGVVPDAVAGHSYGELPALVHAGAIDPEDLPALSRARAEAILAQVGDDAGRMAAVAASAESVQTLLDGVEGVWAVNFNAPTQTVVAGTSAGLEQFLERCQAQGVEAKPIEAACAFHSPLLAGADAAFGEALAGLEIDRPRLTVWSNTTAQPYPDQPSQIRQRLAEHLVNPVRFAEELRAMYDDGARVFIEAGPGGVLTGLVEATLDDVVAIRTEQRDGFGLRTFLRALGKYAASGRDFDYEPLFAGRGARALDLADAAGQAPSATTWVLDGVEALPLTQWREQGEQHIARGFNYDFDAFERFTTENEEMAQVQPNNNSEALVFAYLQNMRAMLDDQRDVMLGYLGYGQAYVPVGVDQASGGYPAAPIGYPPAPALAPPAAWPAPPPTPPLAQPGAVPAAAPPLDVPAVATDPGAAPAAVGLPRIEDLSADQLRAVIVEVVAEKTGYPADMLGLDMDLEADLSIDSIKRLEIIGSLGERMIIPEPESADSGEAVSALERLTAIKTLRGMVDWLQELASGEPGTPAPAAETVAAAETAPSSDAPTGPAVPPPSAPEPTPAPVVSQDSLTAAFRSSAAGGRATEITRLSWRVEAYPLAQTGSLDIGGQRVAVVDDGSGLASRIAAGLTELGAVPVLVDDPTTPELSQCDALIGLGAVATGRSWSVADLFALLKGMDLERVAWVHVFDDTPGALLDRRLTDLERLSGLPGFLKTLAQEYPGIRFKAVTGLTEFDLDTIVDTVLGEATDPGLYPEVYYRDGQRWRHLPEVSALVESDPVGQIAELEAESVVLVLGGAQGISPSLVAQVAAANPCRYILVGRTERDQAEAGRYPSGLSRDQLQRHILETDRPASPKELSQRVAKVAKLLSVEAALALIEQAGGRADYISADLRDDQALRQVAERVKAEHGRLDAVFHAAGVLEDKLFKDKTWDSFERVYGTKTAPLKALGELARELRLVVFFSSMAAAFGNRGQCDYAAGNSALDQAAQVLTAVGPARALSIAWGPWQGAGMVSPALAAEMGRRGIDLIPLEQGSKFFAREVAHGAGPGTMALAGPVQDIQRFIDHSLATR
ncbi:MAG: SDR family NAD(P)-dependent oxidoreductase [Propionibacteriaceae bacterium]|jgi:acyl transferase domain-containing protein/NAD(P)H-dependent flavin oxidoreductase YrpB (nitropropane dioxygenase family)/NAD(P)-dependent dehydrogenase (short-subunit alcohol dehydrogenase family)|nr:SDR family NAD(P)-dependent oxidoreductase [Propionibacteriaceae bacterium]